MSNTSRSAEAQNIVDAVTSDDRDVRSSLADHLVDSWRESRSALVEAFADTTVRRWTRDTILDRLETSEAVDLAERLLEWQEDFCPERRDRSTAVVIRNLSDETLQRNLSLLAASNSAIAFWDRIAAEGQDAVVDAVARIFQQGDTRARETTLHLLILDPYGPEYLDREEQDRILVIALDDPDQEVRGLAAEVVAADMPEKLIERWNAAPLDDSERVRMAFWRVGMTYHPDDAIEAAGRLALDREHPLEARRTALLALGENVSTRTVAPVLQQLLAGDERALAQDAAQLMWRHHRAPDVANAAAASQFDVVRDLGERLLHPERGSPAAGGSRPGDPMKTTDIFDQFQSRDDRRGE